MNYPVRIPSSVIKYIEKPLTSYANVVSPNHNHSISHLLNPLWYTRHTPPNRFTKEYKYREIVLPSVYKSTVGQALDPFPCLLCRLHSFQAGLAQQQSH